MRIKKGKTIILGDLNGRVGTRVNDIEDVIGSNGKNVRNNNGRRIIDFCIQINFLVTNSFFQHKQVHKYFRVVISRNENSIIDYVIINRN